MIYKLCFCSVVPALLFSVLGETWAQTPNWLWAHAIGGTWYDANGLYFFIISQNGNALSATSYSMAGQPTGQGTGSVKGNNVLLNINVTGYGIFTINTSLSENEKVLAGTLKIENNGASYTEPLRLNKN